MSTNWAPPQRDDRDDRDEPEQPDRGRSRRFAILGVTAGLLGGGAVGLLAASPSFTSAAGVSAVTAADDSTTEPAPTPTSTTSSEDLGEPAERRDRTASIRESLQALVDDGTITADQADAVAGHLATSGPERSPGGHRHRGGAAFDGTVLADLLGIDAAELRTALQDGSTIAEVAEAHGVDVQTVIDGLVAAAQDRLDQAVADGRLTDDEAASRSAELTDRITEMVDRVLPGPGPRGAHPGHMMPSDDATAEADSDA